MSIYANLKDIRKLSNASLTSIIDVTNLNFKSISDANLEFFTNVSYDEIQNEITLNRVTSTYIDVTDTFSMLLSGVPTFTINTAGKATGQELLVDVSEAKRRRFTDFDNYPAVGVPGEVVYTGVAGADPTFGEDFIGYLDSQGWVSLTNFNGTSLGSGLVVNLTAGSPPTPPIANPGTGIIWIGAPGAETAYEPGPSVTYYTDTSGNTYDILTNHVWEKVGNDAKLKLPKAVIGDLTNFGQFQLVDGNQAGGYVLTSDGAGNGTWQPGGSGGTSGTINSSYVETVNFIANTAITITHGLNSKDLVVRFIDIDVDEEIEGHVSAYTLNTVEVQLSQTNNNVKVVILSAGGFVIELDPTSAGDGLLFDTGVLSVGATDTTIIVDPGGIKVGTITTGNFADFAGDVKGAVMDVSNFVDSTSIDFTVTAGTSVTAGVIVAGTDATGKVIESDGSGGFTYGNVQVGGLTGKRTVNTSAATTTATNAELSLTYVEVFGGDIPSSKSIPQVFVNGQLVLVTEDFIGDAFFGVTSAVAVAFNALSGSENLYWNGIIAGYDLEVSDNIIVHYGID